MASRFAVNTKRHHIRISEFGAFLKATRVPTEESLCPSIRIRGIGMRMMD